MAGLRDANLAKAYRLMHARGVTTISLAAQVCTSRAYISRVLTGHERRGRTWERVRALLTPEERELLEAVPEKDCRPGNVGYPAATGKREASFTRNEPLREPPRPVLDKTPAANSPVNLSRPVARAFTRWRSRESHAV